MKTYRLALALGLLLVAASAGAQDRFERTQQRINSLLGLRQKREPLPPAVPNPFSANRPSPVQAPPDNPGATITPQVSVSEDDASALARYAAALRVTGSINSGGQPHMAINGGTYKDGDLIKVKEGDNPEYLRISDISARSFTLTFGTATLVVPVKQ